ncbi:MAG TPA: anti-sigma factor [Pyrinomonadaceae bacterium]|nr:anti-sigma factor [Pyrinomonadaceae bacterium]
MITCEESRKAFSPHLDGVLSREAGEALGEHLEICPPCRQDLDGLRSLLRELALTPRPAPPADLATSIRTAVVIERAARGSRPPLTVSERVLRWVGPRLMPYAVGAFYSMLLFVAVFGALRQQLQVLSNFAQAQQLESGMPYSATWADGRGGFDVTRPLSPELSVAARAPFTVESPTLNPRGALARMAWSPSTGGRPDDDDMVVVADVYGNGSASLAAVVEGPRNRRALDELQDALRKNPAFVPASLDGRPQTMRVVFVLQKMNVDETSY